MSDFLGVNQESRAPYTGPVVAQVLGVNLNEDQLKQLNASENFAKAFGNPLETPLTNEVTLPDGTTTTVELQSLTVFFQPNREEVNQIFPATLYLGNAVRYSQSGNAQYITKQGVTSYPKRDTGKVPDFILNMDPTPREARIGEGEYYDFLEKALGFDSVKAKEQNVYIVPWAEQNGFGFTQVVEGNVTKLNEMLNKFSKGMVITIGVNPDTSQMKVILRPESTYKNYNEVPAGFVSKLQKKITDPDYPLSKTLDVTSTFQKYTGEDQNTSPQTGGITDDIGW